VLLCDNRRQNSISGGLKMFRTRGIAAIFLLVTIFQCMAAHTEAATKDKRLEVRASDTQQLRTLLTNRKVDAALTDGTRIKGLVKEVRDGAVMIVVDRSDGAGALPRGDQTVATEKFNTLEVSSVKGKKRWILGTAMGVAGLLLGGAIIAMEIDSLGGEGSANGAGAAVVAATTAGGSAAGYAIGRQLDKKRVTIVIIK
jgi:hypothetical protein